jgi:pilus assembly protein CpaF
MVAVKNIARRLGDDISESKPILDSRLPDGSRVAAVIPPCSLNGVTLTIRKFNSRHFGIEDLIKVGTIERSLANQLENFVLARKNILITGGTGTGKTTLVNILGKFIPPDERILLIEDTSEIQMDQDNLVRFEARQPQNGLPAVSIRDLLKAALRHRPDRIILGEIRGGEAFDLLQLLNTGHSGSLSTVHATSAKQGLARFTSCVLQSGVELPYRAIKSNIGDSLNVVVQLERRPGRRFISEVLEIHRYDPDADEYEFSAIYQKREEPDERNRKCQNVFPIGVGVHQRQLQAFRANRRSCSESVSGETTQRITTAQKAASPEFQAWLRYKNANGADIYVGMNPLKQDASTRTKDDIETIRHLYIDLDHGGSAALEAIKNSDLVPQPNYVLNTSPDKFQVVWKVEGITPEEAEALQRGMVREFGGDPAATDSTRVLRLPGFANKKYDQDFYVSARFESTQTYHLRDFKVPIDSQDAPRHHNEETPNVRPQPSRSRYYARMSQSEHDWAYAKRAPSSWTTDEVATGNM